MSKKSQLLYNLTKRYLLFGYRRFYDSITVVGQGNLPSDNSALIFAPNHLNALMDALAVLYILPKNSQVTFVAKADLFYSKFSSSLMQLAKILPAYRKSDGIENLGKNENTFDQCVKSLQEGVPVGIMPEGGQGEKHYIRPLVKGIFRIAFEAQKQLGNNRHVKIVPIGIDMKDLVKSSSELIINIGKPIDIQTYFEDYQANPTITVNNIKRELNTALCDLTLHIPSKENYDIIKLICDIEGYRFTPKIGDKFPAYSKFLHRQKTAKKLLEIEEKEPSLMKEIKNNVIVLEESLIKYKLKPAVFSSRKVTWIKLILELPLFILGFITNFLPMQLPIWIRRKITVEYDGFFSSIHFGLGLILFPLLYFFQAYLFYIWIGGKMGCSIIFFFTQLLFRKPAIKWWKNYKIFSKKKTLNKLGKNITDIDFFSTSYLSNN